MDRIVVGFDVGIKNLAVCAVGVQPEEARGECTTAKVLLWKIIALAEPKEKIPSVQELSGRLFIALDEFFEELEATGATIIDSVLIENQPSRLNGSMKTMQMMIYSYFQLRRHWESKVNAVHMVSCSQKLQGHGHEIPAAPTGKTSYALNKWKAIQYGTKYIGDDATLQGLIKKYKKADDMHDSCLHVIAWLRKQGYPIEKIFA
jgi:DUF971 family protein